jgi:hypothetical protein
MVVMYTPNLFVARRLAKGGVVMGSRDGEWWEVI